MPLNRQCRPSLRFSFAITDFVVNTNRGTAYILYTSEADAEAAIAHMHESQIDGAVINVSIVLPRRKFSPSPPLARRGANIDPRGPASASFRVPPAHRRRSPPPPSYARPERNTDTYRPRSHSRSRSPRRHRTRSRSFSSRSRSPPRRRGGGGRRDSPARNTGGARRRRSPSYSSYSSFDERSRSRSRGRGGRSRR
jgi:RNA-binding protein with serine-rich domain 1